MTEGLTAGPALRAVRATVLAIIAAGTATLAHVSAEGHLPPTGTLGLLTACLAAALMPLLRRPASARRVVCLLAAGQAVLHTLLTGLALPSAQVTAGGAAHHDGVPTVQPAAVDAGHLAGAAPFADLGMALVHLAAAMVLGLWLASGERLAWRLVLLLGEAAAGALARCRLALDLTGPVPVSAPVSPSGRRRRPKAMLRHRLLLRTSVPRRGPPQLATV